MTTDQHWGDLLEAASRSAVEEIILIAPFIKRRPIERLMTAARSTVRIVIYTRWRPDEVAAGVSDLEVLDLVQLRPSTRLFLCRPLHAKYFRFDNSRLFVGSANLTDAALGWGTSRNLELLIDVAHRCAEFEAFESYVQSQATEATRDIQELVARAAAAFPTLESRDIAPPPLADDVRGWIPSTRNPEHLYIAYRGELERLTNSAKLQTHRDLGALEIPGGLGPLEFKRVVGVALLQEPTIAAIDEALTSPRRFGELRSLFRGLTIGRLASRDSTEACQTTLRWLLYFQPGRYQVETPRYTEIYRRVALPRA